MVAGLAARYRDVGYGVIGAAPTARAARELREKGGIPAGTMHALIRDLDRAGGFPDRTVLVIDEAGMASTRITAAIFAHAERAGTKVVAVGDPGQLASVLAGGWLGYVAVHQGGPALRQVLRQRDPGERSALEALHDGHPDAYLDYKRDAIAVHESEADAIAAPVDQWDAARRAHGSDGAVMIARDNQTRELLNHAARQRFKQDGSLAEDGSRVAGREYAPGDRIVARQNHPIADLDNGTMVTVVAIDARTHQMVITTAGGEHRALDLAYVANHVEYAYALTAHSAQGATVQWAGVIGRPGEFTKEWDRPVAGARRDHDPPDCWLLPGRSGTRGLRSAEASATAAEALETFRRRLRHSEVESLALERTGGPTALSTTARARGLPSGPPSRWRGSLASSARRPTLHL
jgi:ATP-dependent exoDNAse (exonuclease V) alpha subunit